VSDEQMPVINKDLNYYLHRNLESWMEDLALEAETSISYLSVQEQDFMRYELAKKIYFIHKRK
jgi:hypothetical protein